MSRSGYSDDCDGWGLICWRGAVTSAIKGKRGQAFLVELRDALDAMPDKRLVTGTLEADGQLCTLGALGAKRGLDMSKIDAHDRESVAQAFGIAQAMAAEIVYENDETPGEFIQDENGRWVMHPDTPHRRWKRMRAWVESNIQQVTP